MRVILASASPRRRELLGQIGIEFEVLVSHVEEKSNAADCGKLVEELSGQKAWAVLEEIPVKETILVIGADTVVSVGGKVLGKPKDTEDAVKMLGLLSGGAHQVYTGVTLLHRTPEGKVEQKVFHEATTVHFYPMSQKEIADYVATGDPMDKAGAYGIQGMCARYIKGIEGDYSNVVGLPVGRLYQEMKGWLMAKGRERQPSEDLPQAGQKKAVIFDLDGTLSDSIASIKYCGDKAMEPFGYGPFTEQQYKYFVGDGAANLVKRALAAGGDDKLEHFEEAYALYRNIFQENCMYQVKPYDGIRELLHFLKERGICIAVLSNKPHAETIRVIETLFGKDYFDVIQGQQEGVAIKPSPEGVFQILEKLGLSAGEILYLGDTATDMQTGKAAGAFTVGALWGFRDRKELEDAHADAIIHSPVELTAFFTDCLGHF